MVGRKGEFLGKAGKAGLKYVLPVVGVGAAEYGLFDKVLIPATGNAWHDFGPIANTPFSSPSFSVGSFLEHGVPALAWTAADVTAPIIGISLLHMYGTIIGVFPELPESNPNGGAVEFFQDVNRDAWRRMRRWNGW